MNRKRPYEMCEILLKLTAEDDELLAALAGALTPAAEQNAENLEDPAYQEIRETISAEVERLAEKDQGPGIVIEALLRIDTELSSSGTTALPWATRFIALVSERALHAAQKRWREKLEKTLAEKSPVFRIDERTVIAAPIGPMDDDGLARLSDRILAEVLRKRPRRVVLFLDGLIDPDGISVSIWDTLASDLAIQKVRLERINK
ncbi:MAG: hypothetical protein GY847_16860 [Proteobacteria bacterium]|nr:hypothetical protein [Pseudomonadota bacterium]